MYVKQLNFEKSALLLHFAVCRSLCAGACIPFKVVSDGVASKMTSVSAPFGPRNAAIKAKPERCRIGQLGRLWQLDAGTTALPSYIA